MSGLLTSCGQGWQAVKRWVGEWWFVPLDTFISWRVGDYANSWMAALIFAFASILLVWTCATAVIWAKTARWVNVLPWRARPVSTTAAVATAATGIPKSQFRLVLLAILGGFIYYSWQLERAQTLLACYVAPRQLSESQIENAVEYLNQYEPPHDVEIRFPAYDSEANRYEDYFTRAFEAANWRVRVVPEIEPQNRNNSSGGVTYEWSRNVATSHAELQRRPNDPPNPGEIFQRAMTILGVSGGSNTSANVADGVYTALIRIYERPYTVCGLDD